MAKGDESKLSSSVAIEENYPSKWLMWQPTSTELDALEQIMRKRNHHTIQQTISALAYEEIKRMKTGE